MLRMEEQKKEEGLFDIPIAIIVYKRLDLTKRSFEAIRKIKPKRLYIIADGPRTEEDRSKVEAVRKYLDDNIDWNCEVYRDYAEKNLGLRYRMPSGMAWVFEKEERAIFVEDDIDAGQDFFYFCKELLEKYAEDDRVLMISGSNIFPDHETDQEDDIFFSRFASIWGWATWRRAFLKYDVNLRDWPDIRKRKSLKKVLCPNAYKFYKYLFDDLQYHWYKTWGYQWTYMMLTGKGVGIVPRVNLISNIGMGNTEAEHADDTKERIELVSGVKRSDISFPIRCPETVTVNESYDYYYQENIITERFGVLKQIKLEIRAFYYEWIHNRIKRMEKDTKYMSINFSGEEVLSEEEMKYNRGDKYRQISAKKMRKDAWKYIFGKKK